MGDQKGRAKTLQFSIIMITIPTFLIAYLPTFATAGYYSVALLVLVRIWQGICIGGIHGGFLVYLTETAPHKKRAFFTSFGTIGANLGILLAFIITFLIRTFLPEETFMAWGWRLPYFMSAIFAVLIYLNRFSFKETAPFTKYLNQKTLINKPIKTMFRSNKLTLLRLIGMCCMGSTFYCYSIVFFPYLVQQEKYFTSNLAALLTSIFLLLMIFFIPIGAFICDRVGRRPMLMFNAGFIICVTFFSIFLSNTHDIFLFIFAFILFSFGSALEQSVTPISMIESLPTGVRYSTVSFAYNAANGIFGGTLPLVCAWLWGRSYTLGPSLYVMVMAVITGLVVYFFVHETLDKKSLD
jgi:MHS family proline/betaine transporter-like MFS transporter